MESQGHGEITTERFYEAHIDHGLAVFAPFCRLDFHKKFAI